MQRCGLFGSLRGLWVRYVGKLGSIMWDTRLTGTKWYFQMMEKTGTEVKEAVYIKAINQTNRTDKKRILNLEKGYDEIQSEFNGIH